MRRLRWLGQKGKKKNRRRLRWLGQKRKKKDKTEMVRTEKKEEED